MKKSILILLSLLSAGLFSCDSDSTELPQEKPGEPVQIVKDKITGLIQKGPFINGTEINMYELDSSFTQTGKTFSGQIKDNRGSFQLNNMELSSSFVEFSANGFYFDEVKGDLSSSQLNLFALSDVRDISSVNVNILTHLERRRVFYLLQEGLNFGEAKKQAQGEILNIFGFSADDMSESESLDISINNESNAKLLTIAAILQGEQKVGELTELLASIAADMETDGVLNSKELNDKLRANALEINPLSVQENLINRYQSIGVKASVPNIEQSLNSFLNKTATAPEINQIRVLEVHTHETSVSASIAANNAETEIMIKYGETEELEHTIPYGEGLIKGSNLQNIHQKLENLKPNHVYYFAFTAENSHGKIESGISTFTTLGNSPEILSHKVLVDTSSIAVNGLVNPNLLQTEIVVRYGKDENLDEEIITTLNGENSFELTIKDLQPGTNYYYSVRAQNEVGVDETNIVQVKTIGGAPKFFAVYSDDPKARSLDFYFDALTNRLSSRIILKYKTNEWETEATTVLDTIVAARAGSKTFKKEITGLKMDQEYIFYSTIENSLGKATGEVIKVKTKNGKIIFDPVFIDDTYLYPRTNVIFDTPFYGGLPVFSRGVVYDVSPEPTIENSVVIENSTDYGIRQYRTFLDDLLGGIRYYVKGYATNEMGTFYSDQLDFILKAAVETKKLEVTEDKKVMASGSINNGSQNLIRIGFCWTTYAEIEPSVYGDQIESSLNGTEFSQTLDLQPGHTYYIQAYAENPAGISYGEKLKIEL